MRNAMLFGSLVLLLGVSPAQTLVRSFPVAPTGTSFLGGLEYDCNSQIVWIMDETNDIISAYHPNGYFLKSYTAPMAPGATVAAQPIGAGINPSTGMLWIGDEAERVYEYNPATGMTTGVSWSTTPNITDVSGVAVDPVSGNIYVSQDSAPQKIVEFTPAGAFVQMISLAGISSDPDGLAYDAASGTFFVGDDTANSVYQVNAMGALLNTWNLTSMNISPEGLGIDPINGHLYVGDGFVQRRVFVLSGIVAPSALCVPGPTLFYISVTTSGTGDAQVLLNNVPANTIEGWTFFTLDTTTPVGAGPIFGATPDANTFAIFNLAPVASPGNPLHWTWPAAGVYPATPFVLPPGTFSAFTGTSWDFLAVAVTPTGIVPTFNVSRVTW